MRVGVAVRVIDGVVVGILVIDGVGVLITSILAALILAILL